MLDITLNYEDMVLPEYDREETAAYDGGLCFVYPEGVVRVTGGEGTESWLILGTEKTALIDCGFVFHGEKLAANLKEVLGDRPLDYVILSHSHYDHLGGLPYVRKAYPGAVVAGAAKAASVLEKEKAKQFMAQMASYAIKGREDEGLSPVTTEGLSVDLVVKDGDVLDLGDKQIHVMATGGHTDCSLSLGIEPMHWLFASESTGLYEGNGVVEPAIVKSYEDAMDSAVKCEAYGAKLIFSPHYGLVPPSFNDRYFPDFVYRAKKQREEVEAWYAEGLDADGVLKALAEKAAKERGLKEMPAAYMENAWHMVRLYDPARGL